MLAKAGAVLLSRAFLGAAVLLLMLALPACSFSGRNFDETGLNMLTPGEATYADAVDALGALPTATYRQSDGTVLAHWSYKAGTAVADVAYVRKEAMLQFGADGRFLRLLDTTNILLEPWKRRQLLGAGPGSALMP